MVAAGLGGLAAGALGRAAAARGGRLPDHLCANLGALHRAVHRRAGASSTGPTARSCHGAVGPGRWAGRRRACPAAPPISPRPTPRQHTAGDIFWWVSHGHPAARECPASATALSVGGPLGPRQLPARPGRRRSGPVPRGARRAGSPVARRARLRVLGGADAVRARSRTSAAAPVLLVLFTLPASRPRLDQLAQAYDMLRGLGAEVIAVPAEERRRHHRAARGRPADPLPRCHRGSRRHRPGLLLFRRALDARRPPARAARATAHGVPDRPPAATSGRAGSPAQGKGWARSRRARARAPADRARGAVATAPDEHVH